MLRFLWRFVAFLAEMNGYTPFFQALFKANLAIIVGGLSRSEWVGMLRFRHCGLKFSYNLEDFGIAFNAYLADLIVCQFHLKERR